MSETGRIDYSPDYKSEIEIATVGLSLEETVAVVRATERARLERLVIEAAKAWNFTNHRDTVGCAKTLDRLSDAVDALVEFENKQKWARESI